MNECKPLKPGLNGQLSTDGPPTTHSGTGQDRLMFFQVGPNNVRMQPNRDQLPKQPWTPLEYSEKPPKHSWNPPKLSQDSPAYSRHTPIHIFGTPINIIFFGVMLLNDGARRPMTLIHQPT